MRHFLRLATLAALVATALLATPALASGHTLTYGKAKRAGHRNADRIAHKHTKLTNIFRISRHRYQVQAKWTRIDPDGCKGCGYDETTGQFYDTATTEYCDVDLRVMFRSRRSHRLRVVVVSKACF